MNTDTAPGSKEPCHLYIFRIHEADEVFHDNVDAVFMEVAMIAETEEIKFQALALHHTLARDIADAYLGEVGLPGDGAEGGELRAAEPDPVVVLRVLVEECLQHFGGIVRAVVGLLAQGAQSLLLASPGGGFFFLCHGLVAFRAQTYEFFPTFGRFSAEKRYFRGRIHRKHSLKPREK